MQILLCVLEILGKTFEVVERLNHLSFRKISQHHHVRKLEVLRQNSVGYLGSVTIFAVHLLLAVGLDENRAD